MRRTRTLTAAVGALAAAALFAAPAQASTSQATTSQAAAGDHYGPIKSSCSGTKVATWKLKKPGTSTVVGRTELWYSSANSGQNCVITYNTVAGSIPTGAQLWVDDDHNRKHSAGDRTSYDYGKYASYAGASYRNSTNGKCVKVKGEVTNGRWTAYVLTGWRNCG